MSYPMTQGQPGYPPQQGQGYPPQGQLAGAYPPQGQPAGAYPPQGQPAGAYPPQGQPAGAYPPQGQPAGSYPPQGQPAGAYPQGQPPQGAAHPDQVAVASAPEEVENYIPSDASGLKQFDGYGDVGFEARGFLAPPPPPSYDEQQPPSMEFGHAASITAEEARAALLEHVAQNCCYGKGAAEKMEMRNIKPSNAMHYTLETFCEARSTARVEVPYLGDTVDGPYNGPPPLPWDLACAPSRQFADQVYQITVPHTEEVRMCGLCVGGGYVRCKRCRGIGRVNCFSCNGRGRVSRLRDGQSFDETCTRCYGTGKDRCNRCEGNGRVPCQHCKGQGRVKTFIQLTITYKNHVTDYILEETAMPDELVRSVSGVEIFNQVAPQVWPITTFPLRPVNDNSVRLVEKAKRSHPTERQLNQRQILRAVPVTEVDFTFEGKTSQFWVYGMQRKVHAPDYPQQCCCGCTIL